MIKLKRASNNQKWEICWHQSSEFWAIDQSWAIGGLSENISPSLLLKKFRKTFDFHWKLSSFFVQLEINRPSFFCLSDSIIVLRNVALFVGWRTRSKFSSSWTFLFNKFIQCVFIAHSKIKTQYWHWLCFMKALKVHASSCSRWQYYSHPAQINRFKASA